MRELSQATDCKTKCGQKRFTGVQRRETIKVKTSLVNNRYMFRTDSATA